jgi:hypothetical protein
MFLPALSQRVYFDSILLCFQHLDDPICEFDLVIQSANFIISFFLTACFNHPNLLFSSTVSICFLQ